MRVSHGRVDAIRVSVRSHGHLSGRDRFFSTRILDKEVLEMQLERARMDATIDAARSGQVIGISPRTAALQTSVLDLRAELTS